MLFSRRPYLLVTVDDGHTERRTISGDRYVVGSGSDCDLQLASRLIAERHLVLHKQDGHWIARVEGLNPVEIEGERLADRDRTVRPGEKIVIAGLVTLVLRDPHSEAVERTGPLIEQAARDEQRTSPLLFAAFATVMLGSAVAFIFVMSAPPPSGVNMYRISIGSIDRSVASLPVCLDQAVARLSPAGVHREFDLESPFWSLAARAASDKTPVDAPKLENLKETTRQWLYEGMKAERRGDSKSARQAYEILLKIVPDMTCEAHLLAARRLQTLGN